MRWRGAWPPAAPTPTQIGGNTIAPSPAGPPADPLRAGLLKGAVAHGGHERRAIQRPRSTATSQHEFQFAALAARRPRHAQSACVGDYILPRRDFTVTQRPNDLRPHRITSSVATNANTRMAALMLAYLVDYTRPFLLPNVKRGLVAAGRDTELDQDGLDYLGALEWTIFDHLMLPRVQLMVRLGSSLKEFGAFGNAVLWIGRRRGFGPLSSTRPAGAGLLVDRKRRRPHRHPVLPHEAADPPG